MVFGFVKQSDGHVKAYSEVGHGTTIKLYLPPASGQADVSAPSIVPNSCGTETILVVEDDALVRNFVVTQLHTRTAVPRSHLSTAVGRSILCSLIWSCRKE
jgi:hypothetical protein